MADLVPPDMVEQIVGTTRHRKAHYGRAVSATKTAYILHSHDCRDSGIDLRDCRFSIALDRGIRETDWAGLHDRTVALGVWQDRLIPLRGTELP